MLETTVEPWKQPAANPQKETTQMKALYSITKTNDEGLPIGQGGGPAIYVGSITLPEGTWLVDLSLRNQFGRTNAAVHAEIEEGLKFITEFNPALSLSGISRAIVSCDTPSTLKVKAANRSSDLTVVTTVILAIPVEESK